MKQIGFEFRPHDFKQIKDEEVKVKVEKLNLTKETEVKLFS